jgi:hypothetical protein
MITHRSWNISHPIGCPGYVKPIDPNLNDTAPTTCKELSLSNIECNLPFCPFPNDTKASGLDTLKSKSKLLTSDITRKVGTQIQYQCLNPSNFLLY